MQPECARESAALVVSAVSRPPSLTSLPPNSPQHVTFADDIHGLAKLPGPMRHALNPLPVFPTPDTLQPCLRQQQSCPAVLQTEALRDESPARTYESPSRTYNLALESLGDLGMLVGADVARGSSDAWRRPATTTYNWLKPGTATTSVASPGSLVELDDEGEQYDSRGSGSSDSSAYSPSSGESSDHRELGDSSQEAPGRQSRRQSRRRRRLMRLRSKRKLPDCWRLCPQFYGWLAVRVGTPDAFVSIVVFVLLDMVRRDLEEWANDVTVGIANPLSVSFMTHLGTFLVSLVMCRYCIGRVQSTFSVHLLWRWSIIACLLAVSYLLQGYGVTSGLDEFWVTIFSYAGLPLAILIGRHVFRRRYGRLELLAASTMTLGIGAFSVLRMRCAQSAADCDQNKIWANLNIRMYKGIAFILMSVFLQMVAWTGAELLLKVKSKHLKELGVRSDEVIWLMLAHLAPFQVLITGCSWVFLSVRGGQSVLYGNSHPPVWFGTWTSKHFVLVAVYVIHMCLTVHVIKKLSVVSWSMVLVVSGISAACVSDPLMHRYNFDHRAAPSLLLAPTVFLSAIIFQTGRLNLQQIYSSLGGSVPLEADEVDLCHGWWCQRRCSGTAADHKSVATVAPNAFPLPHPISEPAVPRAHTKKFTPEKLIVVLGTYSSVIVYILAQAFREDLSQKAQSSRVIVPQSLNLATSVVGLVVANASVWWAHGFGGLVTAWNFRKIAKFLFAAFLFAVAAFLSSMAFALGASAAAKDAAGRIYTPAAAFLSRWVLGKFYSWLEWLALIILTLSCMAFGLLDSSHQASSLAGLMCATGSGIVSAGNSLVMERLMRGETEAYVVQSVRLSVGMVIFNGLFVYVMGMIGDWENPPRTDFAYWNYRPLDASCRHLGACTEGGAFKYTDIAEQSHCTCDKGLFVGWSASWPVFGAIVSGVIYNFATGLVVKQFSSVYRSVADGIMLMVLYFLLTPLLDNSGRFPFWDMAKNMVVLMVPVSGTTFTYAASEMQKVMEAVRPARGDQDSGSAEADASSEDSGSDRGADESSTSEDDGSAEADATSPLGAAHV